MIDKHLKNTLFSIPLILCIYLLVLFSFSFSYAGEMDKLLEEGLQQAITVDLRDPTYCNGVFLTEKGGVVTAPHLRIQALHICYTYKKQGDQTEWTVDAEGDLIVEFGEYVFVGEKLSYDFASKKGVIQEGRTSIEPWFFGGEQFELRPDGSYLIYNGYVTTSEKKEPDWGIYSDLVEVEQNRYVKADQVRVKMFCYTVFWIPSFRANLNSIFDSPIRYRFRWGGRQGPRVGLTYEIFSWDRWKTFFRFDYRLTRGPGMGIETHYRALDNKTEFHSINYLAKDSSILKPHEKARYRLEGHFRKSMDEDRTTILCTYDKISDRDMPGSYYDRDFDFDTSERTQLLIRREEPDWIGNFYTRVRINSFQTVKQELPSFDLNLKTVAFEKTGILFENWANVSYLDFKYSKFLPHIHNYTSTRFEYQPTFYRPFSWKHYLTLTPETGFVTIFYGNSPEKEVQYLWLAKGGLRLETQLYRYYGNLKHVIEPYAYYRYYSSPTSSPCQHDIFDISDGWTRLNYLSFGIQNTLYAKPDCTRLSRVVHADLYSFAFFDTDKMYQTIPKVYLKLHLFPISTLKYVLDTAWNIEHQQLDFFNMRSEWTLNADFALALEYRHRGPYRWRKVEEENFFLDVFRSEKQLRHSPLSDRRDTLLLHFFYRFHPNWAFEFTSRQGWNRHKQPNYCEFEIDFLTTIQSAWQLRLSYQHQENDDRIALYLNMGLKRPRQRCQNEEFIVDD